MPLLMVKKKYFKYYEKGKKDVELRNVQSQWKNSKIGDEVVLQCGRKIHRRKILKIHKGSLARIFMDCDYNRIFPDAKNIFDAVKTAKHFYPRSQQFMAFELDHSRSMVTSLAMKKDVKAALGVLVDDLKKFYEEKGKRVVTILGSFDTWCYMDYLCRLVASQGHLATTSLYIYSLDDQGNLVVTEREDPFRSLYMESSLRLMIFEECHKAVIAFSMPGAHYIETVWCFQRCESDQTFETVGIAFVRKILDDPHCNNLVETKNPECSYCNAGVKRTAWLCIGEEAFCPFIEQGIAKNVAEYFFRCPRMRLFAANRLDTLALFVQRFI